MYLWRAADTPGYFGQWSCWSANRMDAMAYTDNAGFGGDHLYRATVDPQYVLDLSDSSDPWRDLALALYPKATSENQYDLYTDWQSSYSYIWEVWENQPKVAAKLARSYDWVVYLDNYPDSAVTWCYLGKEPVSVTED